MFSVIFPIDYLAFARLIILFLIASLIFKYIFSLRACFFNDSMYFIIFWYFSMLMIFIELMMFLFPWIMLSFLYRNYERLLSIQDYVLYIDESSFSFCNCISEWILEEPNAFNFLFLILLFYFCVFCSCVHKLLW